MLASPGQPGGWPPLSHRSREEIINCTLGLVCRGPEGRVGWSAGENSLLNSEVMEWFPVLNRFSVPIVAVSALPMVRTTFVCGSEPGYQETAVQLKRLDFILWCSCQE